MHYHLEIIMPPVPGIEMPTIGHIKDCVEVVMAPFHEEYEGEDKLPGFWDWYVIGGRFAGAKMQAALDPEKLEQFHQWCQDEKLTVSGLVAGKQELSPANQIPKVDAKWAEFFPEFEGQPCPIFKHSNDQYDHGEGNGQLPDDVMHFRDAPRRTQCSMVMVIGPKYDGSGMEAEWMITDDAWNGCNHMPIRWDGTFGDALSQFMDYANNRTDEYRAKHVPTDNWLVVTVDYHS